jgi:hypothetical protein
VLRPLLIVEFLIALQAVFTCWSQIGGQYHLDLMFWPWKLVLSATAALLTTALTASLIRTDGVVGKRVWLYGTLLLVTIALAGMVTYYYHLHEPTDEDDQSDQPATITKAKGGIGAFAQYRILFLRGAANRGRSCLSGGSTSWKAGRRARLPAPHRALTCVWIVRVGKVSLFREGEGFTAGVRRRSVRVADTSMIKLQIKRAFPEYGD